MTSTTPLPSMQYVRLGKSGLKVSKICLGCMSYGSSKWFPWVLEEEESIAMIGKAYEAGINFFDTANIYSSGESEKILGKAIKKFQLPRGKIVVATKVCGSFIEGQPEVMFWGKNADDYGLVNQHGLSRKHIFQAIDDSLRRLDMDFVDLYQIHRFDPETPVEETMEALHDLVKLGKVRYIGCSSMYAWQFQKMQNAAEKHGWTKFISMQNMYNLIYREEEREMVPYCLDSGVSMIPWSPLARGILARRVTESSLRSNSDVAKVKISEIDSKIIDRVFEVAEKHNATPAQIAVAWVLSKPVVSSPILGISKEAHLHDLIRAIDIKLTEEDVKLLEEAYEPKPIYGHN